ncbi:alpha/beta-hydrolase [Aspergillus steynii IBT 23096]|uniref:Alpha/beta-hydrolase n=1 Tax=Aspergillus steynii IBT 23096 TaxID=1392250 RepID=A0A2I2FYE6_9EURO|nr:alpha/beta-hydrolase [Aspergillus steynii IBT 23096]PLB45659.1 alpha/beta-hydrolase [Aspergillus steynii IBT 23096]
MPILTVNDHQLHYADSHPDGAPENGHTFIFIHGLGSSQNYYFPVVPHLTNHRCVTLDTYGAARSPYTSQPVSISSIASDVIGVLDALHIPQAVVVGHSMGGLVVTLLGAQYADRVKGVVAIGPTHPSEALATGMRKRYDTVSASGMEPMANSIPAAATGTQCSALTRSFIRELLLGQNPKGYAALCQAIATAPTIDYSAVKAPFLLIAGEEDKSASMEGCQHIFDRVSSANKKMEVLQGVGHWHCLEAPDQVGKTIASFVGGL